MSSNIEPNSPKIDQGTGVQGLSSPSPSGSFYREPFQFSVWWERILRNSSRSIASGFFVPSIAFCGLGLLIQAFVLRIWYLTCRPPGFEFAGNFNQTQLLFQQSRLLFSGVPGFDGVSQISANWFQLVYPTMISVVGLTKSVSFWGLLVLSFLLLGMWSWIGTYISRRTALILCDAEGPESPFRFANQNFLRCWCGLLIPITIAIVIAVPISLFGSVLANTGILMSFYWILMLPFLLLAGILLLSVLASGMLFPSAVGVDRSDAFESISRCFSYLLARPLQFFLNWAIVFGLVAVVAGVVGQVFFIAQWWMVNSGAISSDASRFTGPLDEWIQFGQIRLNIFFQNVVLQQDQMIPVSVMNWVWKSILLSLFFSIAPTVYLSLRRSKDETPLDKIYLSSEGTLQEIKK